jgi:predicted nucleic acid-binding protein
MILVDTSVWIDHLHSADAGLVRLLEADEVCCHPFVIAELAAGNLARRAEVLGWLHHLPQIPAASHSEVLALIDGQRLWGRGLSVIDLHLLAAAKAAPAVRLWTRDKRLNAAAAELGLAADPKALG